jgi:hypothetical protein
MQIRTEAALPLLLVLAGGCATEEGGIPGGQVSYTESRQPCREANPLRELFFGDLHFHTRNSWDAYAYYLTVSPEEAYGFAKGGTVWIPPADASGVGTRQVQLDRPLDFAAATDHAEFLGETRLCTTPGSKAYDTPTCQNFRKMDTPAVTAWGLQLIVPEGSQRFADACGADGALCTAEARKVWKELQTAAEEAYDRSEACAFVSFVGYEHTATPKATNMHRNVIFRNASVVDQPISYYEEPGPVGLWSALKRQCLDGDSGCDVMVIPHNMNMSNGNMFEPQFAPEPGDEIASEAELAALRARMEPVLELFQHKGDQECHGALGGAKDPECAFEKERPPPVVDCGEDPGWGGMNAMGCLSRWDFLRGILLAGLAQRDSLGLNPFRLGVIGSTDTHNGTPGNTWERGWPGNVGSSDDTPEDRLGPGNTTHRGLVNNPGGLAAVWAVERSRDAIWEAMQRRETYATSGTRIAVRFFGGWDLPDGMCDAPHAELAETGYRRGVPMGGVLPGRSGDGGPRFVVWAEHDPGSAGQPGVKLQQIQIVKGWIDGAGTARHRVVVVAGDPQQGSADPKSCQTDGAGAKSLCASWQDADFNPGHRAFYYARVLEVPTCRWSTWECIAIEEAQRPEGCSNPDVQQVIQERAWTSAIWYEPG